VATSFGLKVIFRPFMNHNSIGTFSGSAQIWGPKNVFMNKILQKKWSYTIKHSRKSDEY